MTTSTFNTIEITKAQADVILWCIEQMYIDLSDAEEHDLKPVMDKLADEFKDKAGFYYADIEDGGINTGSAAGVRGVPTVIIYKKGIEVDRKVGGVPESNMKEFLEKNI